MSEKELVENILSWVERTNRENMQDDSSGMWERRMVDRYLVLTEDIEKLCKERLNKLPSPRLGIAIVGEPGPEFVYIPPGSSVLPVQSIGAVTIHVELDGKVIAEHVAKADVRKMLKSQQEKEREREIRIDMARRNCEE